MSNTISPGHQELPRLLEALENARPGREALVNLANLRVFLEDHFAAEEQLGGFLGRIVRQAPWLKEEVTALRREHASLLASIDYIGARLDGPPEVVAKEVELFVQLMRAHEAAEGLLFQHAAATTGGSAFVA
jgi:hypothetical protein